VVFSLCVGEDLCGHSHYGRVRGSFLENNSTGADDRSFTDRRSRKHNGADSNVGVGINGDRSAQGDAR